MSQQALSQRQRILLNFKLHKVQERLHFVH